MKRWSKRVLYPLGWILVFCTTTTSAHIEASPQTGQETTNTMIQTKVIINQQSFNVFLYDNPAARAFIEKLPLNIKMKDLYQNEKYHYLPHALPSNPTRKGRRRSGELMLFGTDCIVLFYHDFSSDYWYTPLGHVQEANALPAVLGRGDVEVRFE